MLRHEARHLDHVTVGVAVDQHPHDVLRAELVLGGKLAVVPCGVDQERLVASLGRPLLAQPASLPLVAPSILSADFADLGAECRAVVEGGADLLHLDVMDGHFVPNLTMGPALCRSLRESLPDVFLDVHLMVTDPTIFVGPFRDAGADHLTFHLEAIEDPPALAREIQATGMSCGVAVNPSTALPPGEEWTRSFDLVLVMSVNPGFPGQSFIASVLEKVTAIRPMLRQDQRLQMDGGINATTAAACRKAGCDVLVAASAIFAADDYAGAIAQLRGPIAVSWRS